MPEPDVYKRQKEGREGMALGQYIAGMGFSNVGLGIAHSMAHTLGAVYDTPVSYTHLDVYKRQAYCNEVLVRRFDLRIIC